MANPKRRIVAIDDDPANLRLVEMVLSPEFDVTPYDRPKDALAALRTGDPPDLIVCDVTMPGLDGFELHEELRKIASVRSVPFLFLTALADRDHVRRGMSQGADDYVTKPFTAADLRAAVAARLDRAAGLRKEPAERALRIRSLDGAEIMVGETRLHWEAKRVVEALLYLLDHDRSARLDALARDLYREPPSKNNIHVLLSRLRKTLTGVGRVVAADDDISLELDAPVTWDAAVFERLAAEALSGEHAGRGSADPDTAVRASNAPDPAALERAIAHYEGPFLPSFESPWAERARSRLEEAYLALLEAAVSAAPSDAALAQAEDRLERFLGLDDAAPPAAAEGDRDQGASA